MIILVPVLIWLLFGIRTIRHPYTVQKNKLPWIIIRDGLAKWNLDVEYHEFGYRYPEELVRKLGWRYIYRIGLFTLAALIVGIISFFQ